MKKTRMPLIGIVATAMFTGIVSSVNVPFASVVYADTKGDTSNTDDSKDARTSDTTGKDNDTKNSETTDNDKNDASENISENETIVLIEGTEFIVPQKSNKWINHNGYWYFVKDGNLSKGWKRLTKNDGESVDHLSFFDKETGRLYTGWRKMGEAEGEKTEHMSYFGPNGWLRTGWQVMGNDSNPDGKNDKHMSYFGPNGWLRTDWQVMGTESNPDGKNGKHISYFGPNGWLRTEWKKMGTTANPDGDNKEHWSYFGPNGWLRTSQWFTNSDGDHYFDGRGWMLTGRNVIGNKLYDEVKKKNIYGILKRNTTYDGWFGYNDKYYYLQKGETLSSFNGVSQVNKKGTWYYIKNGVTNGPVNGTCILAHASGDERGKFWNGKAGDQTKSEVYFKAWFNRPWKYVLRPKDATMREKLVTAMTNAAYNEHIGYDMLQRKSLYMAAGKVGWDLSKVTKDVETDCSALVSTALVYAGLKPKDVLVSDGNLLYTTIMKDRLMATGKFTLYTSKEYISGPDKLQRGDILVLAPDGHTAVVVQSISDLKNNK